MKIFPKGIDFFEMFDLASENIMNASTQLIDLFRNLDNIEERVKNIHDLEKNNDLITHEIMRKLNLTFITPIDREDIHALASRLDDILDLIWAAVDRFKLFELNALTEGAIELAECLQRNVDTVTRAIHNLRLKKYSYVKDLCIEINRLENEADRIFKSALGNLFNKEKDPINIIKWKDVLEDLENANNECEDVANILESVVLKNA